MQSFKYLFDKKNLKPLINFGKMPLGNGFVSKKIKKKEYTFNLKLGFNKKLKLVQLYYFPSQKKCLIKITHFYHQLQKV